MFRMSRGRRISGHCRQTVQVPADPLSRRIILISTYPDLTPCPTGATDRRDNLSLLYSSRMAQRGSVLSRDPPIAGPHGQVPVYPATEREEPIADVLR